MAEPKKPKHEFTGDVPWTWDDERNAVMPDCWYIDPSAQRTDKTEYATLDEAKQFAYESARILGRGISVWKVNYEGHDEHVGRVLPDGSFEKGPSPMHQPEQNGKPVMPDSPVAIGSVLRRVAAVLRDRHDVQAADEADRAADQMEQPVHDGLTGTEPRTPSALLQLVTMLNRVLHNNPIVSNVIGQSRGNAMGQRALVLLRGIGSDIRRIQTVDHERANRVQIMLWLVELLLHKIESEVR